MKHSEHRSGFASILHWPTAAALFLLFVLFLTYGLLALGIFGGEGARGRLVQAKITWLSVAGTKYQKPTGVRVEARTIEGAAGVATFAPFEVKGCKIGDAISAWQEGVNLDLKPRRCR